MSNVTRSGAYGRPPDRIEVGGPVVAVLVAAVEFAVAWLASSSVAIFTALTGLAAMSVAVLVWPTLLMVLAFPTSFGVWRVGPAAIDMSLADFTAALAALASLPFVPWRAKAFRTVLKVMLAYCAIISISVVANPSAVAAVEVVHRFVMVMGAVCIGSAVVNLGKVTAALRALMVFAAYYSVVAIVDAVSSGFEPAYVLGLQKNSGGALLCITFIALFLGHRYVRWPLKVTVPMGMLFLGGMAAVQSRGSITSLISTAVVYFAVNLWKRRRQPLVKVFLVFVAVAIPLAVVGITTLQNEDAERTGSDVQFTSRGSREVTFTAVWNKVIVPSPVTGAGPKWFNKPGAPTSEPHNIVLSEWSSTGALGLIGLVGLLWVCLRTSRTDATVLGELAFYALLARCIAGMFDIFWVAGPNTLPFLMFGLGVGASAVARDRSVPEQVPAASS